jgi:hypothetical protein
VLKGESKMDWPQGRDRAGSNYADRDDLLHILNRFAFGLGAVGFFRSSGSGTFAFLAAAVRAHGAKSIGPLVVDASGRRRLERMIARQCCSWQFRADAHGKLADQTVQEEEKRKTA